MKKKKNILITGAVGFIGSHLSEELIKKGYVVFGLALLDKANNNERPLSNRKNFYFKKCDIQDSDSLVKIIKENDIKTIFHLAAAIPRNNDLNNPFLTFNVNARGTLNLLNAAYKNGVRKFIYASTMSVYSEPPKYLPVDENHPTLPSTIYGASKLEGEIYCNVYSKKMNITVLRYSAIYGSGQYDRNAIRQFVKQALGNKPITIYGGGVQTSDFTYVKDIIQANILAMEKDNPGVYNIGSGKEISVKNLAEKIIGLIGSKSKIILSGEEAKRPFRFFMDIKKAQKDFGYAPLSLDQGLSEYILEFKLSTQNHKN